MVIFSSLCPSTVPGDSRIPIFVPKFCCSILPEQLSNNWKKKTNICGNKNQFANLFSRPICRFWRRKVDFSFSVRWRVIIPHKRSLKRKVLGLVPTNFSNDIPTDKKFGTVRMNLLEISLKIQTFSLWKNYFSTLNTSFFRIN